MRSVLTVAALAALLSCKDASDTSYQGSFIIKLVDAAARYDEMKIVFRRIEIHRSGASDALGWRVVSDELATHDIITLRNGVNVLLVSTSVPEGAYDKIRVFFKTSSVRVDGVEETVFVPSDLDDGVVIDHSFTVQTDGSTGITFDFDAVRSIRKNGTGTFELRPIIRLQNTDLAGSIRGSISPVTVRAVVATSVDGDSVTTLTLGEPPNNSFELVDLPEGTYDIRVSPDSVAYMDTVLVAKTVVRKQTLQLGAIVLQPR